MVELFLTYRNSVVIADNVMIQKEAERIKVNTIDLIRTLHSLDLGIRGYAIIQDEKLGSPYDAAWIQKDQVFGNLEKSLLSQQFEMSYFYKLRDSVNSYFEVGRTMMNYLKAGDRKNFEQLFKKDPGYDVWVSYKDFSARIELFENSILKKSKAQYNRALEWNYLLLVFLLILIIPTLFYTAYQTSRTVSTLDKLKESEKEKNLILATQNETLERLVKERTEEIAAQNEEIISQNEEISLRNDALSSQRDEIREQHNKLGIQNSELRAAQKLIVEQSEIIQKNNRALSQEVRDRTESLVSANKELAQYISQLEQFTFIVSHNLRAPVARILGLGGVLDHAKNHVEIKEIVSHLVKASQELDGILSDLNLTIQIKSMVNEKLQTVDLKTTLEKIENILRPELQKSNGILDKSGITYTQLNSVGAYMESIFFNLISNALKYRDPNRDPVIRIYCRQDGEYVIIHVHDNGTGIDLEKHGKSIFNLYKRFHFHIEGKGLGLYLVKTQVNLLGGEISVESKVGEGTVFIIRIRHNNRS